MGFMFVLISRVRSKVWTLGVWGLKMLSFAFKMSTIPLFLHSLFLVLKL